MLDWFLARFGLPSRESITKFVWEKFSEWDYARADECDAAIWDEAPDIDQARAAIAMLQTDPVEAFQQLLSLADRGSLSGMGQVAYCYYSGKYGVLRDTSRGEEWYRRAYEAGSQRALLSYARVLAARKEYHLRKAAYLAGDAKGWASATFGLAMCLRERAKTPTTLAEVRRLLEKAQDQGSPAATFILSRLYMKGRFGLGHIPRGLLMNSWSKDIAPSLLEKEAMKRRTVQTPAIDVERTAQATDRS
jgi:TPR repeat protein